MCATKEKMLPIPPPDKYDPTQYELVRRVMRAGWNPSSALSPRFSLPNNKSDWKLLAGGDSLAELVGALASEYVTGPSL